MSVVPLDVAPPVVLQRWRCAGHDRLYVRVGERDLGYRDLRTGDAVCEDFEDLAAVRRATASTFERIADARAVTDDRPRGGRPERPDGGLALLGPAWHLLHAVPVGTRGATIDHLAIGPGGVLAITMANRPARTCVRHTRHEARRAHRLLTTAAGFEIEVRGAVAVVSTTGTQTAQRASAGVTIVALDALVPWLRDRPPVLDPAAVDRIFSMARHLSAWQPLAVA